MAGSLATGVPIPDPGGVARWWRSPSRRQRDAGDFAVLGPVGHQDAAHEQDGVDTEGGKVERVRHLDLRRRGEPAQREVREEPVTPALARIPRQPVRKAAMEFEEIGGPIGFAGDEARGPALREGDQSRGLEVEGVEPGGGAIDGLADIIEFVRGAIAEELEGEVDLRSRSGPRPGQIELAEFAQHRGGGVRGGVGGDEESQAGIGAHTAA